MTVHPRHLFEPKPSGPDRSAHDHLVQLIREFASDDPASAHDLVLDLTGTEPVVTLPAPPTSDAAPAPVLAPVVNRARYRRVGIEGVSTRPGELSELAMLVGEAGEPDVLRLILAAQRRSRHPSAGGPG